MGLQDRNYYQEDEDYRGGNSPERSGLSAVTLIILANVAFWLVNAFLFAPAPGMESEGGATLTEMMELRPNDIFHPLQWYRLIACGFAHADGAGHIMANMLGLFFLGPYVEMRYGKKEFLWFYFTAILIGSLCWVGEGLLTNHGNIPCVGASGAISAVVILFAFNFPHEKLLLFFFIPMPAWLAGVLLIVFDMVGTGANDNVAHGVHLAGAAFACLYYLTKFHFTGWFGGYRPNVVRDGNYYDGSPNRGRYRDDYDPDDYVEKELEDDDSYGYAPRSKTEDELRADEEFERVKADVEQILRKISQTGMESLTANERRRLQEASTMYRNRK